MKRIILGLLFLMGTCFSQCLAWRILGINNESNEVVGVQLVKGYAPSFKAMIPAHTLQQFDPSAQFECPKCEWFINPFKDVEDYLLVTAGEKSFMIFEGGHVESSSELQSCLTDVYGHTYCEKIKRHQGPYAIWVCEVMRNQGLEVQNLKILAWVTGLSGMIRSQDSVLKIGLIKTRKKLSAKYPDGFREDIVLSL